MKTKLQSLLFAALLAGPLAGNATIVDWAINGKFSFITGSEAPGFPVQPGDLFSFVMHFDPTTLGGGCDVSGASIVCHYNSPSLSYSNGIFGTLNLGGVDFDSSVINVYDNAISPLQGLGLVDGYLFRGFSVGGDGNAQKWSVYMLTENLGYFNGPPGLPSAPPSLDGLTSRFRFCKSEGPEGSGCERVLLQGPIFGAASVPEPGTFVLLSLGLAGLASLRRRRH